MNDKKLRQVESRKRHVRVPCSNRPLALALFPKQTCQKSVTPKHGQQRGTTHQGRARHRATKKVIHCLCLSTRKESSERIRKTARNVKKERDRKRGCREPNRDGPLFKVNRWRRPNRFDFSFFIRCQWLTVDIKRRGIFIFFSHAIGTRWLCWLESVLLQCLYVTHVQSTDSG